MTISWSIDPAAYLEALTRRKADAIERDIVALVDGLTDQATAYMQQNARWQDRSGAARAGLWSDVEHVVRQSVTLLLSHDVTLSYVEYLEYAHSGRFEILSTTSDVFWPLLYRGAVEICRKHSS